MRRDLWIGLLLAALVLGVFWPVGHHDFIDYDDPQFITENPQIQSGLSWKTVRYACTQSIAGNWHPVTSLSHALDCEWFGVDSGAHHLVNAFIHALNGALLFLLLQQLALGLDRTRASTRAPIEARRRSDEPSALSKSAPRQAADYFATGRNALVAALFALHPLRVESVAWLSERKDLLAGFFFLLSLLIYALYVKKSSGGRAPGEAKIGKSRKRESGNAETRRGPKPAINRSLYLGSLLCFGLGLMSKPMVVTLPFVLLLLDYWPLRRLRPFQLSEGQVPRVPIHIPSGKDEFHESLTSEQAKQSGTRGTRPSGEGLERDSWNSSFRSLIYEKIPFLLLSGVACWITLRVQKGAGAMQVIQGITWPERLANAITSYIRYLGKMFWPTDLAVIYPHPAKHYFLTEAWPGWEISAAALLLVMISLFCVVQLRWRPYLAVGWCWFLGTLVPVIGLVQVGEQAMADRYTYIPMIGILIAVVWGLSDLMGGVARTDFRTAEFHEAQISGMLGTRGARPSGRWVQLGGVAALALLALLALLTRRQLAYWQNSVSLFEHTVAVTADNPSAEFALAVGLEGEGQASKAMVHYRVAVAIDPQYTKAYYNMGQILRKAGYWPQAAAAYLAAARLNPLDLSTQLNLASVLPHLGRTREAIAHFNKALELDPKSVEGLNNLAWLLCTSPESDLRDGARAVQLAERACSLSGFQTPIFLGTLAAAYAEAGRFTEAVATAQSAAALAGQAGDTATATKNQELAELYRAGKAYRDAP